MNEGISLPLAVANGVRGNVWARMNALKPRIAGIDHALEYVLIPRRQEICVRTIACHIAVGEDKWLSPLSLTPSALEY